MSPWQFSKIPKLLRSSSYHWCCFLGVRISVGDRPFGIGSELKRRTKSDKISTHAISGASMNGDEFLPSPPLLSLVGHPIAVNAKLSAKFGVGGGRGRKEMRSKFACRHLNHKA